MNQGLPIPNMSAAMSAAIRSLAGGEQGNQLLAILQQVMDSLLWLSLSLALYMHLLPSVIAYKSLVLLVFSARSYSPLPCSTASSLRIGIRCKGRAQVAWFTSAAGSRAAAGSKRLVSDTCSCLQQAQAQQQAAAGLRQAGAPASVPNPVGRPPAAGLPVAPARMAELQPARKVMKKRKLAPPQPALPVERVRRPWCLTKVLTRVLLCLASRLVMQQDIRTLACKWRANPTATCCTAQAGCCYGADDCICALPVHGKEWHCHVAEHGVQIVCLPRFHRDVKGYDGGLTVVCASGRSRRSRCLWSLRRARRLRRCRRSSGALTTSSRCAARR